MSAYIHIVIGVLFVTQCSFSQNLNCTRLTTLCPTAAQWMERGKLFKCHGNKKYICLMATGNELREGCIFNFTIQAGQTGCPYTTQCDRRTGQPVLVAFNNYLLCPPDYDGCPPRNHSGYSILEIYKYARCQGRNSSDESSVLPQKVTGVPTTILPSKSTAYVNWTSIIFIAFGLIVIAIILIVYVKCKKNKCLDILPKECFCSSSANDNECHIPMLQSQYRQYDTDYCRSPQVSYDRYLNPSNTISDEDTPLHKAAFNGHIDKVKILIDAKADVNAKNRDQTTPLHKAALNGHIEIVKMLIDAKADVNAKDWDQDTPLHKAALNGHNDTVKKLIDAEADVNANSGYQDTPLHKAASNGHSDIVKILINAKAGVNVKDRNQDTPLHKAAFNGHIEILKILIDAKADVNVRSGNQNTPLHMAVFNGHIVAVKKLIQSKSDVNAKGLYQETPLHVAASNGFSDTVKFLIYAQSEVNAKGWYLDTPLHKAASNGHIDTVEILIHAKADVNAKSRDQDTPLHKAAKNGHVDTVKILIKDGADVNAKSWDQDTPLHKAALTGHIDTVKMLIDAISDVNVKGENQDTPIHKAASNGHIEIVKILLNAKADVNGKNLDLDTPLHKAALNGHSDIVKILVDAKADVHAKSSYEDTPLHKAALHGHSNTAKILIDAFADVNAKIGDQTTPIHKAALKIFTDAKAAVNAKRCDQETPLHKAALNGHIDTVKILIEAEADVNAKSWNDDTPLHKAASNGRTGVVKILIDANADVSIKSWFHDTPLHTAALNGHTNTVKELIDAKADVNAKGLNQDTPLHKAASNGHSDTIRTLINAKADVNAKDCHKNTPLHHAARGGHVEIIRILLASAVDFSIRNNSNSTAEELGNQESKQVFKDCFEQVPREIKRLGVDAIRQFLKSLSEDAVPTNVVSCMFVGHVGVGKTTLVNNLLGLPAKKAKMTSGIDLHTGQIFANIHTGEWHIQDDEKISVGKDLTQIQVWDFAGKMLYNTIQQDYLSPRCLFVLVLNACLGMDGVVQDPTDKSIRLVKDYIDFWVATITTYVQSDVKGFPKIAIVGTHIDQLLDSSDISQIITYIKDKFQYLVDSGQLIAQEDLFINALDVNTQTTSKLRSIMLSCGKSYPEYGQKIPRPWNDLHQKLTLRKSEKVIAFDQLEQMNSQMEKPLHEQELILCVEYFHSLGYLLFFSDEEMKDRIILDPKWIVNAMVSFVNCSNFSSKGWREKKKLEILTTTGKIKHVCFDKLLQESHFETRDRLHVYRVMKKLGLISEPKVYNTKGDEVNQAYIYMPCMVKTDISANALSLIENEEAVHLAFYFSTVIPPAVYNRLVTSSLSLWPVFKSHIYNGLIILRSGPLHLIAFRREYKQIKISVVHLEDQRHISVCLCRTIVDFVTQMLTKILSFFNTSSVERRSLFHIVYISAAAKRVKTGQNEEEEDDYCEQCDDRCRSDVTQETPCALDDLFLMRVASSLKISDLNPLAAIVYNKEEVADNLQSEYPDLRKSDRAWLILMEWSRQVEHKNRATQLEELRRVLNAAGINPHILCKVIRLKIERPLRLNPTFQTQNVHSELLHAVADRISREYIYVGLTLGLTADTILKLRMDFRKETIKLTRAVLQEWYHKNKETGRVRVANLATALLTANSDISALYEFEMQGFDDGNGQTTKTKQEDLKLDIMYRRIKQEK